MLVLGIESSCDETAVAVVSDRREIRADLVLSQADLHGPYGGIVPEIAARSHLDHLDRLVARAMAEAGIGFHDLAGVAATAGPGLIGGLIVGVMCAKAIALVHRLPFLAINHLEGHALSARLSHGVAFPYLLLLVSGGHCQLIIVEGVGRHVRLGTTIDDAVGEAFDKTARLLDLPYPGGPAIERAAASGDPTRFELPRPMRGRPGCDFSFAGLKTAVRQLVERQTANGRALSEREIADVAASFQSAVADVLCDRAGNALAEFARRHAAHGGAEPPTLVVAGGVAANRLLRERLAALADRRGFRLVAPPLRLCTDNAAMIAWAGIERLGLGLVDGFDFAARPRWPLDPSAPRAPGAGVKA